MTAEIKTTSTDKNLSATGTAHKTNQPSGRASVSASLPSRASVAFLGQVVGVGETSPRPMSAGPALFPMAVQLGSLAGSFVADALAALFLGWDHVCFFRGSSWFLEPNL